MSRPVAIDLFCGPGGASAGYHRAGFRVIGVDIKAQPNYPYEFVEGDALTLLPALVAQYRPAAIVGSPPCQRFTRMAGQHGTRGRHLNLIPPIREAMRATGLPYVIENVEPARSALLAPVMLCGTMFGLGVFRHRLFELGGFAMLAPPHARHTGSIGDGRYVTVTGHPGGASRRDGIQHGSLADWRRAMNIDWMTSREMALAIPPAYTEHIGAALLASIVQPVPG